MNTIGELKSASILHRHPESPILTAADVPYDASLVFNAGIIKYQGEYVMVFRNDYGCTREQFESGASLVGTNIGLARSRDGVRWTVASRPCFELHDEEILRAYDPRLTVIDGVVHMCFAVDTRHGCRGGIATTEDFEHWTVHHMTVPDNRNMVLFPEKVGGRYCRLERPFPVYSRGAEPHRFDIWFSDSPDVAYWGNHRLVLGCEQVAFCNDKIGPAAPPVKTEKGWLTLFHAVDIDPACGKCGWETQWTKRYTAGIMLLDLEEPWRVIGRAETPLLVPETPYERDGFRGNVIFPGGMVLEDSGEVKVYYGAADTVECLATADVGDLLALCGV